MSAKRKHKEYPSAERIRALLSYDPDTGIFRWMPRSDRCPMPAGTLAGWSDRLGYLHISIGNEKYLGHRLAWKYVHGVDAVDQIDHINGNPADNRICNLRISDQSQNLANRRRKASAKYPKGVSVVRQNGKVSYIAQVCLRGDVHHVGTFPTAEEAGAAYFVKAREIHGEFANAG